jgi:adenosylcobinamide-GDP ribazoletransferase
MTATDMLRARLGELAAAFGLLTRLPAGRLSLAPAAPRDAVWAYPLVGACLGALGALVYWLLHGVGCTPALAALWAFCAMLLATGALHEDGLADLADGLAGGTSEQRLAIMRDHRIGAYGVVSLLLGLGIQVASIAALAAPSAVAASLIAACAAGRLASVLLLTGLTPARDDGMGFSVGRTGKGPAAAAIAAAFVIAWLVLSFTAALLMLLSAAIVALALGADARARLGGQTGDVLGAAVVICQALALTLLVMLVR